MKYYLFLLIVIVLSGCAPRFEMASPYQAILVSVTRDQLPKDAIIAIIKRAESCLNGQGQLVKVDTENLMMLVLVTIPGPAGERYERQLSLVVEFLLDRIPATADLSRFRVVPKVNTEAVIYLTTLQLRVIDRESQDEIQNLVREVESCITFSTHA